MLKVDNIHTFYGQIEALKGIGIERMRVGRPDVAFLDIRMPGTDGMDLHRKLIARESRIPVIFITGHGDIPLAVAAIQRGAFDFLTKPFSAEQLGISIDRALEKGDLLRENQNLREALDDRLRIDRPVEVVREARTQREEV